MSIKAATERVGVCSWSLQPKDAAAWRQNWRPAASAVCNWPWIRCANRRKSGAGPKRCFARTTSAVVSGMFGCVGEDYSTLESIRLTGGIAPDATWEQNRKNIRDTVGLAARMGLKLVTFHAGFIPHEETDPDYAKMVQSAGGGGRHVRRRQDGPGLGNRTGDRARAGRAAAKAGPSRTWE